jgi:hypothetical protein
LRQCVRGSSAQSTVEVIAAFPLVVVTALVCVQGMALLALAVRADGAAQAAAVVWAEQGPGAAERGARSALPGWARGSVKVRTADGRVQVTVRPRTMLPGLSPAMRGSAVLPAPGRGG